MCPYVVFVHQVDMRDTLVNIYQFRLLWDMWNNIMLWGNGQEINFLYKYMLWYSWKPACSLGKMSICFTVHQQDCCLNIFLKNGAKLDVGGGASKRKIKFGNRLNPDGNLEKSIEEKNPQMQPSRRSGCTAAQNIVDFSTLSSQSHNREQSCC